jgi:hypothetical protein
MNKDQIATKFPRAARLLAGRDVLSSGSAESVTLDEGKVQLIDSSHGPAILISLSDLESALSGFRDTGTWDDYFPPADDTSEDPGLTVPRRGVGIAQYRIDTGNDEDTS